MLDYAENVISYCMLKLKLIMLSDTLQFLHTSLRACLTSWLDRVCSPVLHSVRQL